MIDPLIRRCTGNDDTLPSISKLFTIKAQFQDAFYLADQAETMSDKSTIGRRLAAHPARARIIVAGPRPKTDQKAHDWYRALIVIAGFFVLATLGFLLARAANHPAPSHTTNAELDAELFTGTIISYPDDKRECREQFFDNKTGKMTQPERCGVRALNRRGAPAPSNSIDAVRKSFLNR
jgi:hypothetical protein